MNQKRVEFLNFVERYQFLRQTNDLDNNFISFLPFAFADKCLSKMKAARYIEIRIICNFERSYTETIRFSSLKLSEVILLNWWNRHNNAVLADRVEDIDEDDDPLTYICSQLFQDL